MKKMLLIFMVCIMFIGIGATVSAEEISPSYIASCPKGAKHKMKPHGVGIVYQGSAQNPGKKLIHGYAKQCENCYLVLASQYDPAGYAGTLGKYRLENWDHPITYGAVIYGGLSGTFNGNPFSDPFWAGFQWVYY